VSEVGLGHVFHACCPGRFSTTVTHSMRRATVVAGAHSLVCPGSPGGKGVGGSSHSLQEEGFVHQELLCSSHVSGWRDQQQPSKPNKPRICVCADGELSILSS
jgi:hypothetical protein